ncbi:MAG: ABC transporter permease [Planctomycetota bacterium]
MSPLLAIATKDLTQLVRDRMGFFFTAIFPLVFGVLFGLIFSQGGGSAPEVRVALVDEDGSEASGAYADRVEAIGPLSVERFETRQEAEDTVRTGRRAAMVLIPGGFGEAMRDPFFGGEVSIEVAIDPSQPFAQGVIEGLLTQTLFTELIDRFQDPGRARELIANSREALIESDGLNPLQRALMGTVFNSVDDLLANVEAQQAGDIPADNLGRDEPGAAADAPGAFMPFEIAISDLRAEERPGPRNAFEITIPQANAWALMGCVIGFGMSLVIERSRGTLTRLRLSPVPRWQVLGGKALGCFITAVLVQAAMVVFGVLVFKVRVGDPAKLALAIGSAATAFVGVMMLLAVLGKSEGASEGIGRAVLLVLALGGGAGVPLAFMPSWMQSAASVSPFKWSILAVEGAIWRGYSWGELALPCGVLIGIGVVGFVLGAALFRWSND